MARFAFWNNGEPRPLRTNVNVELPDGKTIAEVIEPLPEFDIYLYEERGTGYGPIVVALEGTTITVTTSTPVPPPEPVKPLSCTPRQARLALLQSGLLTTVEAWVKTQPVEVQLNWEWASEVRRDNPIIAAAAVALNFTEEQLDALFALAVTFP